MAWRSILISNPARIFLRHGSLAIAQGDEVTVPLEDISVIVVESSEVTITARLLAELAQRDITLLTCDTSHIPCGIHLPFQQHSRFLKTVKAQLAQTLPFRKNCWRAIAKRKILNQAACLKALGKANYDALVRLANGVKSGDEENREGTAARIYFDTYMPDTTRQEDNAVNAALNYGYSIMRAAVARALSAHGFLCAVGVHHRSELNQFNLADDFMEVLRPTVDLWTAKHITNGIPFDKSHRAALVSLLNADVIIDGERQRITRATEIMAASYLAAVVSADVSKLKLAELPE